MPGHGCGQMTSNTARRARSAERRAEAATPAPAGPSGDVWKVRRADGSVATGWVLMPLRLFLGVTFLFAGLQKLANPNFFRDASPSSIHAQLAGAARSSPVHAFVGHLVSIAPLVGAVIALGEVAIGLGVLVGLFTRIAAVAGLVLSFGLFLTVSFHSSPYFTGSDIVFVFAWTPFVLAGAGGAPALDTLIAEQEAAAAVRQRGMPRRDVLSRGVLAGVGAVIVVATGGLVAMIGRLVGGAPPPAGGSNTLSGAPSATTAPDDDGAGRLDPHHRGRTLGDGGRSGFERPGRRGGLVHRPRER